MSLNTMREKFGHSAKWILGGVTVAMVVTAFAGLGNNLGLGSGAGAAAALAGSRDDVVATVNGDPLTRGDYQDALSSLQGRVGSSIPLSQTAFMHDYVLSQLVSTQLQLEQAKKLGLTASDAEIQKERQQAVAQSGLATKLGLKSGASVADIDAALAKAGSPSIEDRLPDDAIRNEILLRKLQESFSNQVTATEQDVRNSYVQYHTRHILIDNKKRSDVQAQSEANQILAKAKAPGADFATLAKQYSEDPGTKTKGGDDGFIDQSTPYVPEFKTAAFALKPGQVTLTKSPQFGYFLIKLDAVKSTLPADFDKNKAQYMAQYKQQKGQQAYQAYLAGLNANAAKVVVKDPALAGDRALADAQRNGNPAAQQATYQAALADYQKALKANADASQTGGIHVAMAQAYQGLKQTSQAITEYEAAVKDTGSPDLYMTLGNLYMDQKNTAKAVENFQQASKMAYDDQSTHTNLLIAYNKLGRKDLVAQERDWIRDYTKRQQAAQPPAGGGLSLGGGTLSTGGGSPGVTVSPASGPAPKSPKPPTQ